MTKTVTAGSIEKRTIFVQRFTLNNVPVAEADTLAVEEPLEIRLGFSVNGKQTHKAVSITMRTPGADFELAAGFLFTEGILHSAGQIRAIRHCGKFPARGNTIRIDLADNIKLDLDKMSRNFYTTSSCGVCGKSSLDALATGAEKIESSDSQLIPAEIIHRLPAGLREKQAVFDETGGLHAAALFDFSGALIDLREDVGRHNAVDKLIGAKFLTGGIPLGDKVLFLSGRASFELIQKAVMAQIPIVCAVGAPSSLAVEAAREFNVTLLGFVRNGRFNIYCGGERISI
jgi:FdhD protein